MPPKDTDDIQDLHSSGQAELDDGQITDLSEGAGSSTAADETPKEKDTLSVVRDVIAAEKAQNPGESGSSPEGEEVKVDTEPKLADDENYTDVPFHKHARFQHLLRE
jgi:hypothetical protein